MPILLFPELIAQYQVVVGTQFVLLQFADNFPSIFFVPPYATLLLVTPCDALADLSRHFDNDFLWPFTQRVNALVDDLAQFAQGFVDHVVARGRSGLESLKWLLGGRKKMWITDP
ncbi:hypothetical protein D3C84_642550 [compost metagenome]